MDERKKIEDNSCFREDSRYPN